MRTNTSRTKTSTRDRRLGWIIGIGLFAACLALYTSRMAPSVVPGDPGEYQLVAARWGIAHPPGYGFYALLGNLFTRAVPLGTFAWRANLLSACCASAIVALTYAAGRALAGECTLPATGLRRERRPREAGDVERSVQLSSHLPPLLGALALATGIDLWQHAVHANAHIVTALLATCTLYCLLRWRRDGLDRWLFLAAWIAGASFVQHPLLVFAFPAYAIFVLGVLAGTLRRATAGRPDGLHARLGTSCILQGIWRAHLIRLGWVLGFGLLGLSAYLYYPIRSAIGPPPAPGPTDMHTWAGFFRVVTAQGLRGNLLGFSPREVLQRLWDVRVPLRLQYTVPGLLLAALGLVHLWRRQWRPALLLTLYLACVLFVTVNVLQDEMAYLLGPMVVVGLLAGVGVEALGRTLSVRRCVPDPGRASKGRTLSAGGLTSRLLSRLGDLSRLRPAATVGIYALALLLPLSSLAANWQRMDLSDFRDADLWLQEVEARFVGRGQRAVLLAEWERMTTVYYYAAVEGRSWDEEDVRFVPISAGTEAPFLGAAVQHLAQGSPVYLTSYRPEVAARYRLMPSGKLWRVLPAWPRQLPADEAGVQPVHADSIRPAVTAGAEPAIEVVGWRLDRQQARPGDVLLLDLYMRLSSGADELSPPGTALYFLPHARLGETTYRFTTDSRFNTPWWQPGEIVVERFELPVPWHEPAGAVSLQVGIRSVSEGRNLELEGGQEAVPLTKVEIEPATWRPSERKLDRALGNLRGEIPLRCARVNGRSVRAPTAHRVPSEWAGSAGATSDSGSLPVRPGTRLRVVLDWESLKPIEENYKVFVQLLDANLQVRAQGDDAAPLGGSAPTLLWFPRWRRGMRFTDTHVLDLPPDLPPGSYPLVVGMYGFSTFKRVQVVSPDGDMDGDWITLGHLRVE
jgi:hypothetical protein